MATKIVDVAEQKRLNDAREGELTAADIRVQAVEARSSVRDRLRSEGVEVILAGINRFTSVADAVEALQKHNTT